MVDLVNTKLIEAQSGRIAVFARKTPADAWAQVESIRIEAEALAFADQLEGDDFYRADMVDDFAADEWGDDAPETIPADLA